MSKSPGFQILPSLIQNQHNAYSDLQAHCTHTISPNL